MDRLNELLYELGISKVKLAKILGVSRQMVYNYLDLDDLNKWPKDKKVLILTLLGIKSPEEIDEIKVDTDYIVNVEARIDTLLTDSNKGQIVVDTTLFEGIGKKQKEIMVDIIEFMREKLGNNNNLETYNLFLYLFHFLQTIQVSPELKYMLAYVSKAAGFTSPNEFAFNEDEQFIFEGIMFSAMTLYTSGGTSKTKLAESHRRFVNQIEQKHEEKMSRTLELNSTKIQALKELGYSEITEKNASEVFEKMAEIQSRKVVV